DPFTEKGPILIGNKAFSSEGLKVQFFPDGDTSWVANLNTDRTSLTAFHYLQQPNVLVIAGGLAYIIDTSAKTIIATIGYGHYTELLADSDGTIIMANPTNITTITPDASVWDSNRISFDGIKDLSLLGDIVSGVCFDPTDKTTPWKPFTLNIKTQEISG